MTKKVDIPELETKEKPQKENKKESVKDTSVEIKYKAAEFAMQSRKLFGVSPECVITAFSLEKVSEATKKEAEMIVKKFMNQGVK